MVRQGSYDLCRPVVQVKEGRVVNEWTSRAECARYLHTDNSCIGRVIKGQQKSIGGVEYKLYYKEEVRGEGSATQ